LTNKALSVLNEEHFSVEGKVRKPTWTDLSPGLPVQRLVENEGRDKFWRELSLNGALYSLDFGEGPSNMFRLSDPQGDSFVKLYSPESARIGYQSEILANWVAERSELVSPSKSGFPRYLKNGSLAGVRSYCNGSRVPVTAVAMRSLGRSIAELHSLLASHPDRDAWLKNTDRRLDIVEMTRDDIVNNELKAGPDPDLLAELAATPKLFFRQSEASRIPLHGDLNPGNLMMESGRAQIFDFEDVEHSVLDSCFDLALVIERIIMMCGDMSDRQRVEISHAFLVGYRQSGGVLSVPKDLLLADIPRVLSLRSLCLLAFAEHNDISLPEAEWRKFFFFFKKAGEMRALWTDIFSV
jgi:Ser/Thr protein kinase RdoA (MazF antagonist)